MNPESRKMIGQEAAEMIALRSLTWLLGQDEVLTRFLAETGASVSDLATAARQPEFLGAMMDFIMSQDDWIIAASEAVGLPPEKWVRARSGLPGGAVPDWT
jgi:hypothetical protein